jgi:hypothetical protein
MYPLERPQTNSRRSRELVDGSTKFRLEVEFESSCDTFEAEQVVTIRWNFNLELVRFVGGMIWISRSL